MATLFNDGFISNLTADVNHGWSAEENLRQHPDLRPAEAYSALACFHDHHDTIVAAIERAQADTAGLERVRRCWWHLRQQRRLRISAISAGDARKFVCRSRRMLRSRSTILFSAAKTSTPSVPVTNSPRSRAIPAAFRSSINTAAAATWQATSMASASPRPRPRVTMGLSGATTRAHGGRSRAHAATSAGVRWCRSSARWANPR